MAITVARVLYRLFNALVAIIVARYLGVEKFGMYSTALALINTFLIANDIGSTTLLMREGARDHKKIGLYFGNSIIIQAVASIGFFILALLAGLLLHYNQTTLWLVVILGLATLIYEFRKSFRAVLSIMLKLKYIAIFEVLAGFLTFAGTYCTSHLVTDKNIGLLVVAFIPLVINFLFIITVFFYDLKFTKPEFSWPQVWPMVKEGYIFSIYSIFYTVYLQVSILILQNARGDTEAGLYSAAAKLIILVLMIPQMLFQVALPLMFRYVKEDPEKYKKLHLILFRYLNALGLPIAVGMYLLADPIIRLVYHKSEYLPAGLALQIMAFFLIARFLGNIAGQSLTANDQQKKKVAVELSSLVLLIILNIILINKYGFLGSALATAITEIIIRFCFMIMDFSKLKQSPRDYLKKIISPILASIVMGIFIYFTKDLFNVIFLTLCGILIYGISLWLFRFFQEYDKQLFKQLIPKRLQKNESNNPGSWQQ